MKPQASIFNNFPFLRFTLAFITGIIIRNCFDNVLSSFLALTIFSFTTTLLLLFKAKESFKFNRFFSISIFISFICAGFIYTHLYMKGMFDDDIPENATYSGLILDKAPTTNNRFKYTLQLDCVKRNDSLKSANEKIILYNSDSLTNTHIEPGKRVLFQSKLFGVTRSNNPGEFDFKRYMNLKGIRYQAYLKGGIVFTDYEHFNLKTSALNLRSRLMKMYRDAGISGDEYSVLCALTLGDQNYISNDVKSSFSASGAMHVLSVSGLHVGIIFLIISYLLKPLDKNKRLRLIKIVILLIFLWFYAFISGLSPSVLRSCTMFSFLVVGENLNRRTNTYNTLAVSAFALMLINPLLIFDVGFQLSYLAVTGIVFYQPRFAALIKTNNIIPKYLWDLVTVSLAAQLATTPISIFYFHQFPSYFLITNFIVVPLAALILYAALPFFAFFFIPFISKLLASILYYLTWFLNHSVKTIEFLPGSVIEGLWVSDFTLLLLYIFIISCTVYLIVKRGIYLNISLSVLLLIFIIDLKKEIDSNTQKLIIIYNNSNEPLISFIEGKKHYFYSTEKELKNYSLTMLKNASGNFSTANPEKLEMTNKRRFISNKEYVYFDGNLIKLENKFSKNRYQGVNFDVIYNTTESSVTYSGNYSTKTHKAMNKEVKNKNTVTNHQAFNLKNDGAVLLFLQ
jgi:competence protein ComEC